MFFSGIHEYKDADLIIASAFMRVDDFQFPGSAS
jgi:hypothetical protein